MECGDRENSALAKHAWSHHHPIYWDKVRVVEQQPCIHHRVYSHQVRPSHTQELWHIVLYLICNSLFSCDGLHIPVYLHAKNSPLIFSELVPYNYFHSWGSLCLPTHNIDRQSESTVWEGPKRPYLSVCQSVCLSHTVIALIASALFSVLGYHYIER